MADNQDQVHNLLNELARVYGELHALQQFLARYFPMEAIGRMQRMEENILLRIHLARLWQENHNLRNVVVFLERRIQDMIAFQRRGREWNNEGEENHQHQGQLEEARPVADMEND